MGEAEVSDTGANLTLTDKEIADRVREAIKTLVADSPVPQGENYHDLELTYGIRLIPDESRTCTITAPVSVKLGRPVDYIEPPKEFVRKKRSA